MKAIDGRIDEDILILSALYGPTRFDSLIQSLESASTKLSFKIIFFTVRIERTSVFNRAFIRKPQESSALKLTSSGFQENQSEKVVKLSKNKSSIHEEKYQNEKY